ncbi:hypothetical protein COV24_04920 [candidate division WWE3 bacterium CG10_big_fil_rev_8_21_14_0_10_32_10]|uniref:O-antigen ligase domain-containing protein n=1 Tax=candidate division WWE3 bacterium CG10_big_fil_rev_8_21_14_0_10_32_10 TaxID=1975090 RepID=A0A2H0R8X7_UNCKA|nr:MAG: hypothetical protein COV24_04920 [candidate division WWE3 bacterium CG10_big_fil_rev_8_21_14_0_10_32_10]
MNLAWFVSILLIFSLVFGHIPNIMLNHFFGLNIPFYLYDIVIFIIFITSLFLNKYRNINLDIGLISFFVFNLFLIFFNFKYLVSLSSFVYLLRICMYIASYPFFSYLFKKTNLLKSFFYNLSFFLILPSLLIFLVYPNLNLVGYDPHQFRLYGPFFDPNLYSVFLVILLIFNLYGNYKNKMILVLLFLNIVSVFLTFSRLGVILCLVVLFLYIVKEKKYYFITGLFGLVTLLFANTRYLMRFLLVDGNFDSFFYRILSYFEGFRIYSLSVVPTGFNNISIYKTFISSSINHATSYTDSFILNLLLTGGLINLGFIFALLIFVILNNKKSYINIIIIVLILSSFIINTFFHPYFLIIMTTLIALSVYKPTKVQ